MFSFPGNFVQEMFVCVTEKKWSDETNFLLAGKSVKGFFSRSRSMTATEALTEF